MMGIFGEIKRRYKMASKIWVQAFMVSIKYNHLSKSEFSDFLLSAKNTYFETSTKETVSTNFGDEGDFETGAKRVEVRGEDNMVIKDFGWGNDDYVDGWAEDPFDKIFTIKSIDNYFVETFDGFEFDEFDPDNVIINYQDTGSIGSLEFGDQNIDSMVSDSEYEILFESEPEYEDTYFECFLSEKGNSQKLDLQVMMEDMSDEGKEITKVLNDLIKYYW